MVRYECKNGQQKDIWWKDIDQCAPNMLTFLNTMVNLVEGGAIWSLTNIDDLHFEDEEDVYMSSENNEESGHDLDLPSISHKLSVSNPTWSGCKEKDARVRPAYLRQISIVTYLRYVGVIRFALHVLQLLLIRFRQWNLYCTSKSPMKHTQKSGTHKSFQSCSLLSMQ